MKFSYRGLICRKSPIDLAIYTHLLWEKKPATLIEIGSKEGGSALWFRDTLRSMEINSKLVTIDIHPPENFNHDGITVLQGDVHQLGDVLTEELLASLPRP